MIDSASASRADGDLACAHCAKKFTRIENLRRHERTHTNKGAHVCDTCGRGFSRVDVLSRHAKTHEGHRVGDRQPDMGSIVTSESDPGTGTSSTGSQRVSAITTTRDNLPELLNPTESIIWNPSLSNPPAGPGDARNSVDPFSQVDIASGGQDWTFGISEPGSAIQRHDLTSAFNGPPATVQPASNAYSLGNNSSFDFDLFCNINTASGDLAWDAGSLWSTQDAGTLNNFDWAAFGISPQDVRDLDAPVRAPPPISMPSSRAATPPIDQTEEDKWPTNYQPKRPFLIGTSGHLQEVIVDPLTVPELQRWSRFWLDESTYFKVIASLTSARRIPNADAFRMPKSLYTVNTLISYYFDKFLPQLPILHLPTFQITSAPPLLIAALMMIGACQTTLKGARAFCVDLIEVIRRTIADLFEMDSSNLRNADLLHVSLLTSFAGLWSGHQRSFELAELSRGILINLCRRTRLLESTGDNGPVFPTNAESGSSRWQTWVAAESRKRLGLAIFLFDALFPAFLDMPSYLSQGEMIHTVLPCDDRFWNAPNYHVWQAQLGVAPIPPAPYFVLGVTGLLIPKYAQDPPGPVQHLNPLAAICVINALYHHIWEFRSQLSVYFSLGVTVPFWEKDPDTEPREMRDGFEGRKNWLEGALDLWYKEYYNESRTDCLSLGGRALCHLGYIALNANLKDLFAASGKSGPEQAQRAMRPLRNWANSQSGSKAASHAIRLLKVLDFPRPSSSIYAPISVFVSTLCLWAYVSLRSPLQQTPEEQGPSSAIMAEVYGDEKTTSTQIMKGGVRYLSGCKEWRIGGALALVLAKMLEQGRGT